MALDVSISHNHTFTRLDLVLSLIPPLSHSHTLSLNHCHYVLSLIPVVAAALSRHYTVVQRVVG